MPVDLLLLGSSFGAGVLVLLVSYVRERFRR